MVEFHLPNRLTETFIDLLPEQRNTVQELFDQGVLINYALSLENNRLWATFTAIDVHAVHAYIDEMPLSRFMRYTVNPLTFLTNQEVDIPAFSLN